jgi:putative SOS response-associated peptidase YedK
MCGRYTLTKLADLLKLIPWLQMPAEILEREARYNVAPSQFMPIATASGFQLAQWGFVPAWARGTPKARPINARAETVATSGLFRGAFHRRRCIVPAHGFYEWRKLDAQNKQPMLIRYPDGRPLGFAGLCERWKPSDDADAVDTYTILTTTPNELMASIHDRMPVILSPDDFRSWLDPATDPRHAAKLMRPCPDGELEAVPVGRLVNNPRNDVPECIAPLA